MSDWKPIESAPSSGIVLLLVEAESGERRVFVSEASYEDGTLYWITTVGWIGWSKLRKSWSAIGWQSLPEPK